MNPNEVLLKSVLNRQSLSFKILATVLAVSSVVTAILTCIQLGWEYTKSYDELKGNFQIIQTSHLESIVASVWEYNTTQIEEQLDGITHLPGIYYVEIRNGSNRLYSKGLFREQRSLSQEFTLEKGNTHLGTLKVYADLDRVTEQVMQKALFIFLSQLIKTLIVSIFLYFAFQKLITRHLIKLAGDLTKTDLRTSNNKFSLNRKTKFPDELDYLVENLNSMQFNLRQSLQEIAQLNAQLEKKVKDKTETILLQRQQLEYSSKMSALGQMAGGVAHEINTPLSAIMIAAEMSLDKLDEPPEDTDQEDIKKNSQRIIQSVERISVIIKALKFFSRTGEKDSFKENSLQVILDDTLELARSQLKQKSVSLIVDPLPADCVLESNAVQISQVILNLIQNSIDAIETQKEKWIRISVKYKDDFFQIKVTDSGPGISQEIQKKIMEPFFTTKDIGKGTGLGLSISKGFIEDHNGSISIDNTNPNTCFIITLPKTLRQHGNNI